MKEQLAKIEREALEAITGAENPAALEELRVRYLGKKVSDQSLEGWPSSALSLSKL